MGVEEEEKKRNCWQKIYTKTLLASFDTHANLNGVDKGANSKEIFEWTRDIRLNVLPNFVHSGERIELEELFLHSSLETGEVLCLSHFYSLAVLSCKP